MNDARALVEHRGRAARPVRGCRIRHRAGLTRVTVNHSTAKSVQTSLFQRLAHVMDCVPRPGSSTGAVHSGRPDHRRHDRSAAAVPRTERGRGRSVGHASPQDQRHALYPRAPGKSPAFRDISAATVKARTSSPGPPAGTRPPPPPTQGTSTRIPKLPYFEV
jgi:hypothetical protein